MNNEKCIQKNIKMVVSLMLRYGLGFALVFLCSVIVATVAYNSFKKYIIEEGTIKNQIGISNISEEISEMSLISRTIAGDVTFATIRNIKNQNNKVDVVNIREANERIQNIGMALECAPYMFALFRDNDIYLSSGQCSFAFDDYYGKLLRAYSDDFEYDTADGFKKYIWDCFEKGNRFVSLHKIIFNKDGREKTLIEPILYLSAGDYSGLRPLSIVVFVMDSKQIADDVMIHDILDTGFMTIRDLNSRKLITYYGNVPGEEEQAENGHVISIPEQGAKEKYYILSMDNYELNWKIAIGIPFKYIKDQLTEVMVCYPSRGQ